MLGDDEFAEKGSSVKPGFCPRGRHARRWILIRRLGEGAGSSKRCEFFGVPLVDSSKSAKLAFHTVEVAVVVGVPSDETVAADVVVDFHTFHDVNWKRK